MAARVAVASLEAGDARRVADQDGDARIAVARRGRSVEGVVVTVEGEVGGASFKSVRWDVRLLKEEKVWAS